MQSIRQKAMTTETLSPNFSRWEFACRCGCGFDVVDAELLTILQDMRNYTGRRVTITSGARCESHNRACGGSSHSQHLLGKAADVVVSGMYEGDVAEYLDSKYPNKYGIGRYRGRTHIDVRSEKARW